MYKIFIHRKTEVNMYTLLLSGTFLVIWFIRYLYRIFNDKNEIKVINKEKNHVHILDYNRHKDRLTQNNNKNRNKLNIICSYTAMTLIICSTLFFGAEVFGSAVSYRGKLSGFFKEMINGKTINVVNAQDITEEYGCVKKEDDEKEDKFTKNPNIL